MFNFFGPFARDPVEQLLQLYRITHRGGGGEITTVTGISPLLLANALHKPIHSLKQYGLCTQSTTPTPDAPVDIVCNNGALRFGAVGKNLCNVATDVNGYAIDANGNETVASTACYSALIPVTAGEYTYSGLCSTQGSSNNKRVHGYYNGAWVQQIAICVVPAGTAFSHTFTVPSGIDAIRISHWNEDAQTQVERGSAATAYEPFVGGVYPAGTPEVLTVRGINLLDTSTSNIIIREYINAQGQPTTAANNWRTDYIPVVGGKTYAFWGRRKSDNTISCFNRIHWYTASKAHISPRDYAQDAPIVATAPSNAAYVMLSCAPYNSSAAITRETFDAFNWMFAESSAEIPYEAYVQPQTASVPMLLGVGDYKDEVELVGGPKTVRVGVKVLTGNEEWIASGNLFYAGIATDALEDTHSCYCTHFKGVATNASANYDNEIKVGTNATQTVNWARVQMYPVVGTFSDVTEVKAYLAAQYAAGTPVIVVYPLATETTEQGTPHALHTTEGTNVVDVESGVGAVDLEVEYAAAAEGG